MIISVCLHVNSARGPLKGSKVDRLRSAGPVCCFSILTCWITFHQDPKNIPEDGDGGAEDKDGEEERTDGVCHFIVWLKQREAGEKVWRLYGEGSSHEC